MTDTLREGALWQRDLEDGRQLCVYPRMYNAILTIGRADDERGYMTHYCYESPAQAKVAGEAWDPAVETEPDGWFRHSATGRRRPNGDAAREYVSY